MLKEYGFVSEKADDGERTAKINPDT